MAPKWTPDNYPHVHQPYAHQREDLEKTWRKREWGVFWEMGLGKSWLVCTTAGLMFLNEVITGMVAVAKKGEYLNWSRVELKEHMPPEVPYVAYEFNTLKWRSAPGKREWAKFIENRDTPVLRVLVVNVEAFGTEPLKAAMKQFYKVCKNQVMFVVDEATCIKNHKAKRSQALYEWTDKALMRRILTGLPNPQSPMDFWGQHLALRKGLLGPTTFTAFRGRYAVMQDFSYGPRKFKKIVGFQRLEELNQKVKAFASIRTKDECLDLPEKIYKRHAVDLTDQQLTLLRELKLTHQAEIEDGTITATTAMSLMVKMHQIICGQIKTDDGDYVTVANNRGEAMMDILEEHTGKAIIWAGYRQTLQDALHMIQAEYGTTVAAGYYGGVDMDERPDIIRRFQDPEDDLRFLIANPQTAGYGLTLTTADLAIYYSNSYNLELRLQSEDRIHRIGQKRRPVYVDIFAPDTVDEKIMTALRSKRDVAELVMRGEVRADEWLAVKVQELEV